MKSAKNIGPYLNLVYSGFSATVILLILSILGLGFAVFAINQQTKLFNFASSGTGGSEITIKVNANDIIGTVDPYPLGFSADGQTNMGVWPYNPWQFMKTSTRGRSYLKSLGIKSIRIWGADNDWKQPYDVWTGVPPTEWVDTTNNSCDPLVRTDCTPVKNFGGWCSPTVRTPLTDWLESAGSFRGPIFYVANMDKIYHLKPDYYTECQNGSLIVKKRDGSESKIIPAPMTPEFGSALQPYLNVRDATPKDLLSFLREAKSLGHEIKYIELNNEPWNTGPFEEQVSLDNPTPYINKVKRWYKEIKAFDPTIQIGVAGVQILDPTGFKKNPALVDGWNRNLFLKARPEFDFVILHHYTFFDQTTTTVPQDLATNLSYYRVDDESDEIVNDVDGGDYPKIYRKQLLEFAPEKVNVPIMMTEFNTLVPGNRQLLAQGPRGSLYTGFALGSFYLDHLWPKKVNGKLYPGVQRAFLGGIDGVMALYLPPNAWGNNSEDPVLFPSWHILQALSKISRSKIAKVTTENKPTNSALPSRKALEIRSVISQDSKSAQVIIFNHDPLKDYLVNIEFTGFRPRSTGTMNTVGEGSNIDFTSKNSIENPGNITLHTRQIKLKVLGTTIRDFTVPAHTLVVLEVPAK